MNHLLEIRAICKALLLWLSGANVVHVINRKIRKRLIFSFLRIILGDPVGIQTQDLQRSAARRLQGKNRNLSFNFFEYPFSVESASNEHKFGRLYSQFGKFSIKSSLFWIKILSLLYLSTDASLGCGLKEDVTQDQLQFTAMAIFSRYRWLKASEVMLFFFNFKAGFYERFYSYFDTQIIIRSVKTFIEEHALTIAVHERNM